jgi:hypothetical protein
MSPIDQKTRPLKRTIKYRGCCIDRLSRHGLSGLGAALDGTPTQTGIKQPFLLQFTAA